MSNSGDSVRVRRGTKNADEAIEQQKRKQFLRLDPEEFTRRQRYRDTNDVAYAPVRRSDAIYKQMRRRDEIDAIAVRNQDSGLPLPLPGRVEDGNGTTGTLHGRVLLYARLPRNGKVGQWPRGQVTFTDPKTGRLFTGQVRQTQFIGRAKDGWVVLSNVVDWGRMSDPTAFPSLRKKKRPRNE